jgi:hypothetical protein
MNCPRCGHDNPENSRFCNKCGNSLVPDAIFTPSVPKAESAGSKSIIALVLGILAILGFGFLTGVPAMILAKHEEDEIRKGNSPVAGETLAKLGFWLGLIGTILSGLILAIIFFAIFSAMSLPFIFAAW